MKDKSKYIKTGTKAAEKPTQEELIEIAELCEAMYKGWSQVYKFVNLNKQYPASMMIETLKELKDKGRYNDIWPYAQIVIQNKSMKYYNQKFLNQHERNKDLKSAGDILKRILEGEK